MPIEYKGPENFTYFEFYTSGGANGAFKESLTLGKAFKLGEVRLHLSVKHPSVEDFAIWVSAGRGSAYNQILISQAMSDIVDYLWQVDDALVFNSDDQIIFSMFVKSGSNVYGLSVKGWSVLG
jgi:hypothetical protein